MTHATAISTMCCSAAAAFPSRFRSSSLRLVDAPGKLVVLKRPAAGSFVVLNPRLICCTVVQLVILFEIRVNDPPNLKL